MNQSDSGGETGAQNEGSANPRAFIRHPGVDPQLLYLLDLIQSGQIEDHPRSPYVKENPKLIFIFVGVVLIGKFETPRDYYIRLAGSAETTRKHVESLPPNPDEPEFERPRGDELHADLMRQMMEQRPDVIEYRHRENPPIALLKNVVIITGEQAFATGFRAVTPKSMRIRLDHIAAWGEFPEIDMDQTEKDDADT